jgi:hypothetical protein
MMRHPRRLRATAALVLMLQLILLGSGLACAMPGMRDHATSVGMAQMDMGSGTSTSTAPQQSPTQGGTPCSFPWAPAGCHSMAPCAPVAVATQTVALVPAPPVEHEMAGLVVLAPPSRSTPPELPPPRA